jgi:hypothetical protein
MTERTAHPYMTKREFMEVYRVKHSRFWSEVRKGRIKVLHPTPRCILIKREDAEAWVNMGGDMGQQSKTENSSTISTLR